MTSELETAPFMTKYLWVRIIIMVTCVLSMVGALLIILSFVCSRDLRSRGRQILVHISLMDLGVAVFNFLGASVYFDKYYTNCTSNIFSPYHQNHQLVMCQRSHTIEYLCIFQAGLSLYFTYGSILWTNSLSFYLYFRIVYSHTNGAKIARYCLFVSYIFCYGLPLLLTLWLGLTGRLGYSPYESSGWCSIILMHPLTKKRDIYASVFGYNLWIVLTFIFVPVLSCAVHVNVRHQAENTALYRRSDRFMLALFSVDYKFVLIPLAFILLRFWSFLGDILHLYIGETSLHEGLSLSLIILGGIGDSGQGITNTLIFIFFTKKFKDKAKHLYSKLPLVNASIQNSGNKPAEAFHRKKEEEKSLLDSGTSVDDRISPHQFTSHSYENTTPVNT